VFQRPGPFSFGSSSTAQLDTLHPDLRRVLERAIQLVDFSVTEGRRSIQTQIVYLRRGVTRTIDSRHIPRDEDGEYKPDGLSEAADLTPWQPGVNPWPLPGDPEGVVRKKVSRFYFLQGVLYAVACEEGVDVRLGVDWDSDLDFFDQTFDDLGHIELRRPRRRLKVPEDLREDVDAALAVLA
jgi:peptidoglycan L-alanyl-D-glutamate endopeptidase CwlK